MSELIFSNTPPSKMNPCVKYILASENFVDIPANEWISNKYVTGNIWDNDVIIVNDANFSYTVVETTVTDVDYYYEGSIYGNASIVCYNNVYNRVLAVYKPNDYSVSKETATTKLKFNVPQDTTHIYISYANPYKLEYDNNLKGKAIRKSFRLIGGDWCFDISQDVAQWEELEIFDERYGLSGVTGHITLPISIVQTKMLRSELSAYDIVLELFETYGVHAKAQFLIYLLDFIDVSKYELEYSFIFDFEKYQWQEGKIDVPIVATELLTYVNSKGETTYDIPINEIKDVKPFVYEPLELQCSAKYTIPNGTIEIPGWIDDRIIAGSFPVVLMEEEVIPKVSNLENKTQNFSYDNTDIRKNVFTTAKQNVEILLRFKFNVIFTGAKNDFTGISLVKTAGSVETDIIIYSLYPIPNGQIMIIEYNGNIQLNEGESIFLRFDFTQEKNKPVFITVSDFEYFEIYWSQKSGGNMYFDVIRPEKLLDAILKRMSDKFKGVIRWDDKPYTPLLCSAESIRGFSNAYVHTSLNDFIKWMRSFGYENGIEDKTILFQKRDLFFPKDKTSIVLENNEIRGLRKFIYQEYCPTLVRVGYEKKEYDNTNGRFEMNGIHEYSTGYITGEIKDPKNFISPYRGDAFGVEVLSWTRFEGTTDTKSDNDLFILASSEYDTYFEFYKGMYVQADYDIIGRTKIYNAAINPYFMAQDNESTIGIITKLAEFTSTTNNRDGYIRAGVTNIDVHQDIPITKKIIDPVGYVLDVGTTRILPKDRNGLIKFNYLGIEYKGYISNISRSPAAEKVQEWHFYSLID